MCKTWCVEYDEIPKNTGGAIGFAFKEKIFVGTARIARLFVGLNLHRHDKEYWTPHQRPRFVSSSRPNKVIEEQKGAAPNLQFASTSK